MGIRYPNHKRGKLLARKLLWNFEATPPPPTHQTKFFVHTHENFRKIACSSSIFIDREEREVRKQEKKSDRVQRREGCRFEEAGRTVWRRWGEFGKGPLVEGVRVGETWDMCYYMLKNLVVHVPNSGALS